MWSRNSTENSTRNSTENSTRNSTKNSTENSIKDQEYHVCLVFELLAMNLYELLYKRKLVGISLDRTRKIGYQIATALQFLTHPELKIVHCDLKPENILLVRPNKSQIKLIDYLILFDVSMNLQKQRIGFHSCFKSQTIHSEIGWPLVSKVCKISKFFFEKQQTWFN